MRAEGNGSRARVTPAIEKTVFELVHKETDYQKKKKHPASWYQNQVADKLGLAEKDNPSLRSYEELLRGIKNKLRKQSETEDLWSIGSCDEIKVPSKMIPVLLKIEKFIDEYPDIPRSQILSKRHAKWYARLYPAVKTVVNNHTQQAYEAIWIFFHVWIKTKLENSDDKTLRTLAEDLAAKLREKPDPTLTGIDYVETVWLAAIGLQYARAEQVSASSENNYFDTTELDHRFFVKENLSIEAFFEGLGLIFFTNEQLGAMPKFKDIPLQDLKISLGNITPGQALSLNEYMKVVNAGIIELQKWRRTHPDEYAEVRKLFEKPEVKK